MLVERVSGYAEQLLQLAVSFRGVLLGVHRKHWLKK